MTGMNVFELFGTIAIDNEQANKALSDTGKQASGLSGAMEAAFGKLQGTARKIGAAIATAFAVDKIRDFGQTCAEVYASVAAEESAFEQIMGDYAGMATEKMNQVAEQTGVVATRLTPYMTSMTAKFKGLGFQVDEATSLASEGLTIASDAAAFWDKSLEESMSHLNSFINGSYEGGEAIGLFANDTQMAAYALEQGIVSTTEAWSKLDEATKQSTRMRYAREMMASSGATGQAAKEADEYANVLANMNEQFRQFQAVVGEPIMERIMLPAMRRINSLMPGITRRTGEFIDRFLGGMDRIGASIRSGWNPGAWAQGIGEAVTGAAQDMRGRLTALGQTISETWTGSVWPGMQAFFTELGGKLAGALGTGGEGAAGGERGAKRRAGRRGGHAERGRSRARRAGAGGRRIRRGERRGRPDRGIQQLEHGTGRIQGGHVSGRACARGGRIGGRDTDGAVGL